MKILVINGSAHKGNTWKLVEQAKKQLLECNKEIEFEEVHLIEEKLPFCVGWVMISVRIIPLLEKS